MAPQIKPSSRTYKLCPYSSLKKEELPYTIKSQGLGIVLASDVPTETVLVNSHGDRVLFSGDKNPMATMILSMTMDKMREEKLAFIEEQNKSSEPKEKSNETNEDETAEDKTKDSAMEVDEEATTITPKKKKINRASERAAFDKSMEEVTAALQAEQGLFAEKQNDRRLNLAWNIIKAFSGKSTINTELDKVLVKYCKIRLGLIACEYDELGAAVVAIQLHYLDVTRDNKAVGNGSWTIPLVHILHSYMAGRGVTPFVFSEKDEKDELLKDEYRAKQSKTIWIKKKPRKVEVRDPVRAEMMKFVTETMEQTIPQPPTDEGPPPEQEEEEVRVGGKRRRSIFG